MSLPASEARALTTIEESLLSRDPRFRSLFTIFTRLTGHEAMPAWEQLRPRRWRPPRGLVIALAFALVVGIIVVGSLGAPPRACGPVQTRGTVSAAAQGCGPRSMTRQQSTP